jgi:DNA-binding NtrC family response regulator
MSASSVLVINEIESDRAEIARALEAEGFHVVQCDSAASAVREIWGGSFIVALISTLLTGTSATALAGQLRQMAPEIETIVQAKNDELPRLVRKVCEIRDGVAAA